MTELFLKIVGMSVTACLAAAIVLLLRALLKPAPKAVSIFCGRRFLSGCFCRFRCRIRR